MAKSVYYQRPDDRAFQGRKVEGLLEKVEYSLDSNIRIWHNIQTEGYAPHQHSALEILIPVENEYTVIINKKSFTLQPGDILFVPRYSIHEILPAASGSRFIYMFNMEPLSSFYDSAFLDVVLLEPCLMNKQHHSRIYERVYSGFMDINDIYFPSAIFWEYSIYAVLINILTTIGGEYYHALSANSQISQEKHYEYYQKFTGLLAYIDTHYGENLTLEKMASHIGFSKYHFSRLFKEHTNSTFYDYLSRKRIQAAQEMLLSGESITAIAFQTGFNNPASFSRCFKKYTKYNPTDFRNQFADSSNP